MHTTACRSSHSPGKYYGSSTCSSRDQHRALLSLPPEAPPERAKPRQLLCQQLLQSVQLTAEMSQEALQLSVSPLPQRGSARRCRAQPAPRGSSPRSERGVPGAVTAVSEVALGSCRCTCAGSPGLCGRARTAPCSPGSSATWPRCCKAEHRGRQVRDSRDSSPAAP